MEKAYRSNDRCDKRLLIEADEEKRDFGGLRGNQSKEKGSESNGGLHGCGSVFPITIAMVKSVVG